MRIWVWIFTVLMIASFTAIVSIVFDAFTPSLEFVSIVAFAAFGLSCAVAAWIESR